MERGSTYAVQVLRVFPACLVRQAEGKLAALDVPDHATEHRKCRYGQNRQTNNSLTSVVALVTSLFALFNSCADFADSLIYTHGQRVTDKQLRHIQRQSIQCSLYMRQQGAIFAATCPEAQMYV